MRFTAKATLLMVSSLVVWAGPAFADPPAHAPAHGWRKKNDPDYVGYTGDAMGARLRHLVGQLQSPGDRDRRRRHRRRRDRESRRGRASNRRDDRRRHRGRCHRQPHRPRARRSRPRLLRPCARDRAAGPAHHLDERGGRFALRDVARRGEHPQRHAVPRVHARDGGGPRALVADGRRVPIAARSLASRDAERRTSPQAVGSRIALPDCRRRR